MLESGHNVKERYRKNNVVCPSIHSFDKNIELSSDTVQRELLLIQYTCDRSFDTLNNLSFDTGRLTPSLSLFDGFLSRLLSGWMPGEAAERYWKTDSNLCQRAP